MFLKALCENNPTLADYAFKAHQQGLILPNTYLLDLDTIVENASAIKKAADANHVRLYFMLKQLGRNPLVAERLIDLGYAGAVCVDADGAMTMIDHQIPIGNVGHLVQIPTACIEPILAARPEVVTVYSREKIRQINAAAERIGINQPLLIRLVDEDSELYSGQVGGFPSSELPQLLEEIDGLSNVSFGGFTVFPALAYNSESSSIEATVNMSAMRRGREIADSLGYDHYLVNLPSANCAASMPLIRKLGGNNAEPGHGLTGTTPLHAASRQVEKVAYVYVSELSHNFKDKAYCFGGGYYRRGHMRNALVGSSLAHCKETTVSAPAIDAIDYHFELEGNYRVGDTVVMCYRTQMFVSRSRIAVVSGLSKGEPVIEGTYDQQGRRIE